MTSILSTVTSGAATTGIRMLIGGQEKLGKTTLCAGIPDVLLVPLEVGFAGVTANKTALITSLVDVHSFLDECIHYMSTGQFPFKTLAFDSATGLERLIHDAVISRDPKANTPAGKKSLTMESCHGGYGKGYNLANEEFDTILAKLDTIAVTYGVNVVMTCHVFSAKIMDPTAGEYDAWDLLLHSPKNQKTYGKRERITQWADIIGFLYEPVFINKDDAVTKAVSQNRGRMLGLSRTPAYTAGNRFGITGEVTIPAPPENGWNAFASVLYQHSGINMYNHPKEEPNGTA